MLFYICGLFPLLRAGAPCSPGKYHWASHDCCTSGRFVRATKTWGGVLGSSPWSVSTGPFSHSVRVLGTFPCSEWITIDSNSRQTALYNLALFVRGEAGFTSPSFFRQRIALLRKTFYPLRQKHSVISVSGECLRPVDSSV